MVVVGVVVVGVVVVVVGGGVVVVVVVIECMSRAWKVWLGVVFCVILYIYI